MLTGDQLDEIEQRLEAAVAHIAEHPAAYGDQPAKYVFAAEAIAGINAIDTYRANRFDAPKKRPAADSKPLSRTGTAPTNAPDAPPPADKPPQRPAGGKTANRRQGTKPKTTD